MSLKIIKAGVLDSIQDPGRYGNRKFGINPTGAMDVYSARKANLIIGNSQDEAVIEMHFPASQFLFENNSVIALSGADFKATVDGHPILTDRAIDITEKSTLRFTQPAEGARCYMAVTGGFKLQKWLHSYSTNLKAHIGGFQGRKLLKDDMLLFKKQYPVKIFNKSTVASKAGSIKIKINEILILSGPEWGWLSEKDQNVFLKNDFNISGQSDRMGYRLTGPPIRTINYKDLVSSPVCFGTIQLLSDGSLIVLMADHQTTGGYPRIANVISANHSSLAQKKPGDTIRFKLTDITTAEKLLIEQAESLTTYKPYDPE